MSYTPPPPPPPSNMGGVPGYGPPRGNTKALVSMILGIISLPLALCCSIFGLIGIAAIVLATMAKKEIAASNGAETGAGMAKAGFILGIIGTVLAVLLMVIAAIAIANGDGSFEFNTY